VGLIFLALRYALVGIDTMSKVVMVSTCYTQSAEHVGKSIEDWIEYYGSPTQIYSDNGGPFIHSGRKQNSF